MMGRALLIVGALATLGLAATGVLGYLVPWPPAAEAGGAVSDEMSTHILIGLGTCLLLLFSHCWILIYLLGTGRAVRQAVRERGLETALAGRTRRSRMAFYVLVVLAMGLSLAVFIVGASLTTGSVPGWVHGVLFYAALAVQLPTLAIERRVLDANEGLMAEVDRQLEALPAA
ncbi:MAG TPA: hypothetical protein VMW27_07555 [Thermoanaerobaculia bacterium]|nr:hypothetical protein [Thermoanaerobaculia bacterium]